MIELEFQPRSMQLHGSGTEQIIEVKRLVTFGHSIRFGRCFPTHRVRNVNRTGVTARAR
jgi:hypothetical protein